jgi:hypothetical protein
MPKGVHRVLGPCCTSWIRNGLATDPIIVRGYERGSAVTGPLISEAIEPRGGDARIVKEVEQAC